MFVVSSLDHLSGRPTLAAEDDHHPMSHRLSDLLRALDTARGRTVRLARAVPEPLLEWSPGPDAPSCASVFRYLAATERHVFAEVAVGRPSQFRAPDRTDAYGREGVLSLLEDLHAQSVALCRTLDDDDLDRPVTSPGGATVPTWRWLQLMTEHEAHHRGQVELILQLAGVKTPSLFGGAVHR